MNEVRWNTGHPAIEDRVRASFEVRDGIRGEAIWDFLSEQKEESLKVRGTEGELSCSVFGTEPLRWKKKDGSEEWLSVDQPDPVQGPLISEVVQSLLTGSVCSSTAESALRCQAVMETILMGRSQ